MTGGPSSLPSSPRRTADLLAWAFIAAFTAAWIALMLRNLGYLSYWMDEGFHILAADGILKHGYPLYPSGHIYWKAILYAYVLAGLGKIFGLTATTLRIVSVLSTAGLIILAWFVGQRFFSRSVGLAAAVILAFSAWEVEDARLALYFAPLQLMVLASIYVFYQAFIEDRPKFRPWVVVLFVLTPQVHQLGMSVYFCFFALLVMKGLKRFLKKDLLTSFGLVTLFYLGMQVGEFFFWKVGYVYEKTDTSLRGMFNYFFGSFNLKYFKEFFISFPLMSLVVLGGIFLYLGIRLGRGAAEDDRGRSPWLYLTLGLLFPLLFLAFFRTHVQPRYLAPLHPVFVLLFLVALREAARALPDLIVAPFASLRPKAREAAGLILFLIAAAVLTEGAGLKRVLAIVERRYNDPIETDIITRSGRFEHEDNANTGLYVKHFLRDDDIVVAIHVVFQKVYVGRVDYWLWSGGPGTWDAWEKTPDGWRDFYVGARWINNLADLKKVIEANPARRVWLVGSTSLVRRDHINREIADFLAGQADRRVFRGWDGVSEVYLWNDPVGGLTSGTRTLEGESLPARRGRVAYGGDASRRAWMSWPQGRRDEFSVDLPGEYPPGRYRLRLRGRTGREAGGREALILAVMDSRTGETLRTIRLASGLEAFAEVEASFGVRTPGALRLRVLAPGATTADLDWIDIVPSKELP
ncbi:MAG: glycosyltransferase family 39 protein [Candidatus Aminicenantes bacterium]|nr:glycosyltransferase family 39 protein [Candidatus Aminicenantes bacterium]